MKEDKKKMNGAPPGGFTRFRKEWVEPILIALVLATVIRSFIIQPYKIPSGSMEDTLLIGDYLMALKFPYGIQIPFTDTYIMRFRDPHPGEIVVFTNPKDPTKEPLIKRCVAVGGQTVEIREKQLYVDGERQNLPETSKFIDRRVIPPNFSQRDTFGPVTVPAGHMFMMGDNRDNSNDSRFWGFAPYDAIRGKAVIIWWSWDHDTPLYDLVHHIRWGRIFKPIK